jgi:cytochrome oxidase assembly protein ShyY1
MFGALQVPEGVDFAMFLAAAGLAIWWIARREMRKGFIQECKTRARNRLIGGKEWPELERVNSDLCQAYLGRDRHERASDD